MLHGSIIKPISRASPLVRLRISLLMIACAALALFHTLRGASVSVNTNPATLAASGVSKTLASYWAAISFGVISKFGMTECEFANLN